MNENIEKIDFSVYASEANAYENELKRIKNNLHVDFDWYAYSILSNLHAIDQLLTGDNRYFFSKMEGKKFLDIGAADGDLAFFWESKGLLGTILDYPQSNHNDLKGAYALNQVLNSKIKIISQDIDKQFELTDQYDITFALGLLYHLRNPMYFLQQLALHCEYMFLSTRISAYLSDGKTFVRDIPVSYLLGRRECNNDPTNYWIFSKEGLKRVLNRSGWQILDFNTLGAVDNSTPHELDRDERAFVFAKRYDNIHELVTHHDY